MATITGTDIDLFRASTLEKGLRLELMGMKMSRGVSCYQIIKKEYGFKGSKQKVYDQFKELVDTAKQARGI